MKFTHCLLLLLLFTGCKTPLDLSGLQQELQPFDALSIQPAYELENLRIDIIRQQRDNDLVDSLSVLENVPYHPVGFDLGNGLFFDLNDNLGLLATNLFDIKDAEPFEIRQTLRPDKGRKIRYKARTRKEICETPAGPNGKRKTDCLQIIKDSSSVEVRKKDRFSYKIKQSPDSLQYTSRKKQKRWVVIEKIEQDHYAQKGRRKDKVYQLGPNGINLASRYRIQQTKGGKQLDIYKLRKRGPKLLYSVQHTPTALYIINPRGFGLKLERKPDELLVYRNKKPVLSWERLE